MSELDLSGRRRQALDLLLQGRITHEQYELLLCEIEQTHALELGTLTGHATRSAPAGPKSGEVIEGRFELLEPIGRGAMGVVWKARDRGGDRIVCVKFLPPEIQHDTAELARVKEIFGKVHALQHEHLCPFYLLGDDPRYKTFVVMKFVPGRTLGDYRHDYMQKHGAFPLDEAIWIADRLAQALDYVHRKHLVHRDVKPANILVDRAENDVQLVDLGLTAEVRSSLARVSKQVGELAGTAPYMAPEQWRGQFIDGRADQYALAVTVWELLAGRLPFDCPNDAAWMHCALNEAPPTISSQSASLNAVLLRALSKAPQDRFESCGEFVHSLNACRLAAVTSVVSISANDAGDLPIDFPFGIIDDGPVRQELVGGIETATSTKSDTTRSSVSDPDILFNRAIASAQLNDFLSAIRDFTELIRHHPKSALVFNNRGYAYLCLDDRLAALEDFNRAISINARFHMPYYNRCVLRKAEGDTAGALSDINTSINLKPDYAAALNLRAWILATSPAASIRDGKQAVRDAYKACKLTNWQQANSIDTLAAAYAESGIFKKAVKYQELAITTCRSVELSAAMSQRLSFYRSHQPFREITEE